MLHICISKDFNNLINTQIFSILPLITNNKICNLTMTEFEESIYLKRLVNTIWIANFIVVKMKCEPLL